MTSVKEHFSEFTEKRLNLEVVLGDDRTVRVVGEGIVSFQRESLPPLKVTEVLYVSGLKKNLNSVSTIEDIGYEVVFKDGPVLMYPTGGSIASAKVSGVRHGKLYRFLYQSLEALVSSVNDGIQSSTNTMNLCELWHGRMAQLHHGALCTPREITRCSKVQYIAL